MIRASATATFFMVAFAMAASASGAAQEPTASAPTASAPTTATPTVATPSPNSRPLQGAVSTVETPAASAPVSATPAATPAPATAAQTSVEPAPASIQSPAQTSTVPAPPPTSPPGSLPTSTPTPTSFAGSFQVMFGMFAILALLFGVTWMLKKYGPVRTGAGTAVKIIGGVSVGNRERIVVVEVADQWIVVGVAPGRVSALSTLPKQDGLVHAEAAVPEKNFASWLKQTIDKRNGK